MASKPHRFPSLLGAARWLPWLPCLFCTPLTAHAAGAGQAAASYRVVNLGSGGLTELPVINARGQVVFSVADASGSHAWFYDGHSVIDLGTLGGPSAYALGLNDAGQVAGFADTAAGPAHAFRWSAGSGMVDLGAINGGPESHAAAINRFGVVVGNSDIGSSLEPVHAFRWTPSTGMQDLGSAFGDFLSLSAAVAINDIGTIAGDAELGAPNYDNHGFVWTQASGMVDIGTLGGATAYVVAIDARDEVTGWADVPGGFNHAFLWTRRGGIRDLGTAGGTESFPLAMSAGGQVAGVIDLADGFQHAVYLNRARGLIDLGTLGGPGSRALGVNDDGQVVGTADTASKGDPVHAFLWSAAGGMVDLNTRVQGLPAGLRLESADAIADDGEIVAETNAGLVLLEPDPGQASAPVLGPILGPQVVMAGAPFAASVSFAGGDTGGAPRVDWTWGDGAGGAGATHVYTRAGIYTVTARATDGAGKSAAVSRELAVLEPSAGAAAGIGTFVSPPGAIAQAPARGGKARFAFHAPAPGQGSRPLLLFSTGGFGFRSEDFARVAARDGTVRFEGSGRTQRGAACGFILVASAGAADADHPGRFALEVWHTDRVTRARVVDYDSQAGKNGASGGAMVEGRIVVQ